MSEKKFLIDNEELMKEWDWDKNKELDPKSILAGSHKRAWWKCFSCGYEWETEIRCRVVKKNNCPKCARIISGANRITNKIKNEGSFYEKNPLLMKEWNYEKNIVDPKEISSGSKIKVWWKCDKGHEWEASISKRVRGNNCPICYSVTKTSFPEQAICWYLSKITETKNRYLFDDKELDIYLPLYNIGIEYDGIYWHSNSDAIKREKRKNSYFQKHNITLIRIKELNNQDTHIDEDDNCYYLYSKYDSTHKYLNNLIPKLFQLLFNITKDKKFLNCNIVIENDRNDIVEYFKVMELENSLEQKYPKLCEEWDYEKNTLNPKNISSGSELKAWWVCKNGHSYYSRVSHRVSGVGCPICAGKKILVGYNDLATKYPILIKEWNYEKNTNISPCEISGGTAKKVWWKCKNGHEWQASVNSRTNGKKGCPYCSGRYSVEGINDLKTTNPELIKEWDFKANIKSPTSVMAGSGYKAYWICPEGHSYQMPVYRRVAGRKCPLCRKGKKYEKI